MSDFFSSTPSTLLKDKNQDDLSSKSFSMSNSIAESRSNYMQDIRKSARETVVKSRRQQPNVFSKNTDIDEESEHFENGYEHLSSTPNSAELIVHLKIFNEIIVENFGLNEIM